MPLPKIILAMAMQCSNETWKVITSVRLFKNMVLVLT